MFTKTVLQGIISALLLLLLLSAGGAYADGHCDFADETIRFGGIAPLSPPGATGAGVVIDWAYQQAVADINAGCGVDIAGVNHRIEVLTGDSEGISERGQALAERWILRMACTALSAVITAQWRWR